MLPQFDLEERPAHSATVLAVSVFCIQMLGVPMVPWPWWAHILGGLIVSTYFGLLMGVTLLSWKELIYLYVVITIPACGMLFVFFEVTMDGWPPEPEDIWSIGPLCAMGVAALYALAIGLVAAVIGWKRHFAETDNTGR